MSHPTALDNLGLYEYGPDFYSHLTPITTLLELDQPAWQHVFDICRLEIFHPEFQGQLPVLRMYPFPAEDVHRALRHLEERLCPVNDASRDYSLSLITSPEATTDRLLRELLQWALIAHMRITIPDFPRTLLSRLQTIDRHATDLGFGRWPPPPAGVQPEVELCLQRAHVHWAMSVMDPPAWWTTPPDPETIALLSGLTGVSYHVE